MEDDFAVQRLADQIDEPEQLDNPPADQIDEPEHDNPPADQIDEPEHDNPPADQVDEPEHDNPPADQNEPNIANTQPASPPERPTKKLKLPMKPKQRVKPNNNRKSQRTTKGVNKTMHKDFIVDV